MGLLDNVPSTPCATNIRALAIDLIDKLTNIPSEQTADLGYSGLAEQDAVYALQTNSPWADFLNPGQVPLTNDAWTSKQSRVARNLHTAQKLCYDSESNVRRAINAALNAAIPRIFRRVPGDRMGVRTFRPTDDQNNFEHIAFELWTHDATRKIGNGKALVGAMESKRAN